MWSRGSKSVEVDLQDPSGVQGLTDLVADADVFLRRSTRATLAAILGAALVARSADEWEELMTGRDSRASRSWRGRRMPC